MAPPPPLPRRTLRLGVTAGWQPDASSAEFDVRLSPRALVAILGPGAAARRRRHAVVQRVREQARAAAALAVRRGGLLPLRELLRRLERPHRLPRLLRLPAARRAAARLLAGELRGRSAYMDVGMGMPCAYIHRTAGLAAQSTVGTLTRGPDPGCSGGTGGVVKRDRFAPFGHSCMGKKTTVPLSPREGSGFFCEPPPHLES